MTVIQPAGGGRAPLPWTTLVFVFLGSCVILFIVAPLAGIFLASSPSEIAHAAVEKEVLDSVVLTLSSALWATLACTLAGIPLAYMLARKRFWGRSTLLALIDLPIIVPHTTAGIALLTVIGRNSFFGSTFGSLVGTPAGIAVAMAFVSVPFLINSAHNGFASVPVHLENAARTLGASPARVFFTISLPMAWRHVLSGMIMMWARGISEFGAVVIIAYHPMTTPTLVFERFNDYGLDHARAAALVLLVICVIIFAALRFLAGRGTMVGRS